MRRQNNFGIAMSPDSLAPPTLYLPFLLGGGGRKGSGKRSTDDLSPTNGYYVIPIFTRIYIELELAG